MDFFKINDEGEYTPFFGLTVVSHLQKSEHHAFKNLYEWLMTSDLTRYYAPLPFDSYHMTILNLFNIQSIGYDKWEDFVSDHLDFFKALNSEIEKNAFQPYVLLEDVYMESVIQLIFRLPIEQEELINKLAESFNLSGLIPAFFHMTLAYQYQPVDELWLKKFKIELKEKLSNMPQEFTLEEPKLCYFNDMTAFFSWNGEFYPFALSSPGLKS